MRDHKEDRKQAVEELSKRLRGCTRQKAACLTHEWLLNVKKEQDEADISAASRLRDLYDCHTCVNHVAQMYVKGIMPGNGDSFGMREVLTKEDAFVIARRAADRRYRKHIRSSKALAEIREENLKDGMLPHADYVVDVREPEEYIESHIDGAVNIPLACFCRNPYALTSRIDAKIVFVCERGVKSRMAANEAIKAGFTNVSFTGMREQSE